MTDEANSFYLQRTAQWFLQKFSEAQRDIPERISLEIDWINEDSLDERSLRELAHRLAFDDECPFGQRDNK